MYKIVAKCGFILNVSPTLADAMKFAKDYGMFVTIKGPEYEICGLFGADSIKDGKCPDGVDYSWMKRRNQ
jgi:hypothetical protein